MQSTNCGQVNTKGGEPHGQQQKPSEPAEEERWALKEVNTMKNPLAVQILALSIQILALVVILLKK